MPFLLIFYHVDDGWPKPLQIAMIITEEAALSRPRFQYKTSFTATQ